MAPCSCGSAKDHQTPLPTCACCCSSRLPSPGRCRARSCRWSILTLGSVPHPPQTAPCGAASRSLAAASLTALTLCTRTPHDMSLAKHNRAIAEKKHLSNPLDFLFFIFASLIDHSLRRCRCETFNYLFDLLWKSGPQQYVCVILIWCQEKFGMNSPSACRGNPCFSKLWQRVVILRASDRQDHLIGRDFADDIQRI